MLHPQKCKCLHSTDIHAYETRQANNLYLPKLELEVTSRSIQYMGTKLYNKLPEEYKQHEQFNIHVRRMVIENYYYCIEEFFA